VEWKWVKSLLIVLFLILNCFLGYQVYQRNTISVINSEAIDALSVILDSKNITCAFALHDIEVKKYMKKINISNEKNIEEKFISLSSIAGQKKKYTGRNREIMSLPSIIVNFLRETQIEGIGIRKIELGYYPEITQIDKTILSGEATPAWLIVLESGEEYIYNAYLGNRITPKNAEEV